MGLTREQKREYIKTGGVRCPYCGSSQIDVEKTEISETAYQECRCWCGKSWTDRYTLTGIDEEEERAEPCAKHPGEKVGDCGCRLMRTKTGLSMQDCPLHAAARAIFDTLKIVAAQAESARKAKDECLTLHIDGALHRKILQAIARGEGRSDT
ncbi:MAG: hypothetical protein ACOYOS_06460 [Syntrophales bacterium]